MKTVFRHADTMIAVSSRPAWIDFDELLGATEVVYDESMHEPPWENCDGFAHTATPVRRINSDAGVQKMQGLVYCHSRREYLLVALPPDEDYDIYNFMRANGASKQVAREAVAAVRRKTLRQLVRWYDQGWEWYGVRCRFYALGKEYEDSLWGIADADCAEALRKEVAWNVADQLEKDGYTVRNKPLWPEGGTREGKQVRIRHNMALQNWSA